MLVQVIFLLFLYCYSLFNTIFKITLKEEFTQKCCHHLLNIMSSQTCKFISYVEHKIYFEEPNGCWSPLTFIVGKEILRKSMGTINCLHSSKIIFMFNIRKKLTQVWNDMRVRRRRQISFLGEQNYPFKGLVHPKMKISLRYTHPQSILGLYDFLLLDESNWSYIKHCPGPSPSLTMG